MWCIDLINYLILNSSSQNEDYLLILLHAHVSAHTMVVKLFTLILSISLNDFLNNKWVVFLLYEF